MFILARGGSTKVLFTCLVTTDKMEKPKKKIPISFSLPVILETVTHFISKNRVTRMALKGIHTSFHHRNEPSRRVLNISKLIKATCLEKLKFAIIKTCP